MLQTILNCHSLPLWGGRRKKKKKCSDHRSKDYGCFHAGWTYQADALENAVRDLLHGSKPKTTSVFVCLFHCAHQDWKAQRGPACIFWSVPRGTLLFARGKQPARNKHGCVHRTGANPRLAEATARQLSGTRDTHFGSLTRSLLMKSLARALVLLKYSSSNS